VNLEAVQPIGKPEVYGPKIELAAKRIRYVPFTRSGTPTDAWVQDTLTVWTEEEIANESALFPEVVDWSQVSITLRRSGCYGWCRSYSITIHGDGRIGYVGDRFVSIPGPHKANTRVSRVRELLDRFRAAHFFGFRDSYHALITDNPTYQVSLRVGTQSKTVTDYMGERVGMPTAMKDLESAIDATADSARWVTASPQTPDVLTQDGIELTSAKATEILHTAVYEGDLVTTRHLLAADVPIGPVKPVANAPFGERTAQSLAELVVQTLDENARVDMLRLVLTSNVVMANKDSLQKALASVIESGETKLARILISAGADPSVRFVEKYGGKTPDQTFLMLAASSGVWSMIDDALARPHEIRAVDSEGRTALVRTAHSAPQIEDIFPIVDRFLAAGASRSELDRVLLDSFQPNWIHGLVTRGGNINARDVNGNTPIFQACTVEGIQALLDAGANPYLRNHDGKTTVETTFTRDQGKEDPRAAVIRKFCATHTKEYFRKR
jgi:hypothetical protein